MSKLVFTNFALSELETSLTYGVLLRELLRELTIFFRNGNLTFIYI